METTNDQEGRTDWLQYLRDNLPRDKQGKYGTLDDLRVSISHEVTEDAQRSIRRRLLPVAYDEFFPPVIISYATGYRKATNDSPGKILAAGVIAALFGQGCPVYSDILTPSGRNWSDYMMRIYSKRANAQVMIVLMTRAFFRSVWCLEEVYYALKHDCIILPVRVEELSESGKEISRDLESMWPDKVLDMWAEDNHWDDGSPKGRVKVSELNRVWAAVTDKLMNTASIPAQGTLLNDEKVLADLVSDVKGLSGSANNAGNNWIQYLRDNLRRDKEGKYGTLDDLKIRISDKVVEDAQRSIRRLLPVSYDDFFPPVIISHGTGYRTAADDTPGNVLAAGVITAHFEQGCPCYSDLLAPSSLGTWDYFTMRINTNRAKAQVVIVLMTRGFFRSVWCLREVHFALEHGCVILPVRVEGQSENGIDISRDKESMWPSKVLDAWAEKFGWNEMGAKGKIKIKEELSQARLLVTDKLMNTASIPAQGTLLNDEKVLAELVSDVKGILGSANNVGKNGSKNRELKMRAEF